MVLMREKVGERCCCCCWRERGKSECEEERKFSWENLMLVERVLLKVMMNHNAFFFFFECYATTHTLYYSYSSVRPWSKRLFKTTVYQCRFVNFKT